MATKGYYILYLISNLNLFCEKVTFVIWLSLVKNIYEMVLYLFKGVLNSV